MLLQVIRDLLYLKYKELKEIADKNSASFNVGCTTVGELSNVLMDANIKLADISIIGGDYGTRNAEVSILRDLVLVKNLG